MRQTKRCPKCSGSRIGVVTGVFDHWKISLGAMADSLGLPPDAVGTSQSDLERTAYLCADCGYYETYVSHPEKIDYGQLRGKFAWLNPPAAPFR